MQSEYLTNYSRASSSKVILFVIVIPSMFSIQLI